MKKASTEVTIIIPCFNRWPFICEAIDSVIGQDWPNTKCIVVDDASTDDTANQLTKKYENNKKVTIITLEENQGQSSARNQGAYAAQSEHIGFLDSDDILHPSSVSSRIYFSNISNKQESMLVGDRISEVDSTRIRPYYKKPGAPITLEEYIEQHGWINTNNFLIRRETFFELGGFDATLSKKEDIEFFLRALCHADAIYTDSPCAIVRDIADNRARHDYNRIIKQGKKFSDKIKQNPGIRKEQKQALIEKDTSSFLHALYKNKEFRLFREEARCALAKKRIRLTKRIAKRYLLSFIKSS